MVPQAPGFEVVLTKGHRRQTLLFGDEFQSYLFPHDLELITGEEKLDPHSVEDEEIKSCGVFRIVFKGRKARQENRRVSKAQESQADDFFSEDLLDAHFGNTINKIPVPFVWWMASTPWLFFLGMNKRSSIPFCSIKTNGN